MHGHDGQTGALAALLHLVITRAQITLQGSFTLSDSAPQLAVTGGTGKNEGANLVTLHVFYPYRATPRGQVSKAV